MPELPDIEAYIRALSPRILDKPLVRVRVKSPFLVRTVDPALNSFPGQRIVALHRIAKRIGFEFEDNRWIVVHLMIGGRFQWAKENAPMPGKLGQAAFDFPNGTLLLTEAGTKRRAALHTAADRESAWTHHPGGVEPLEVDAETFSEVLTRNNHTLKRALTDQHLFSGIGNAYSDEILHRARLSPVAMTQKLPAPDVQALYQATQSVLREWIDRLCREADQAFPKKVTAFRKEMSVHGRFDSPCPECGTAVQRIRRAHNEVNYCPRCQTKGKVLADRSLSRLLKKDWPNSIDELESRK